MITRPCLILPVLTAIPGWSQATGTETGTQAPPADEQPDNQVANSGMLTPPPVSGEAYAVATGDEVRNNYMTLGVTAVVGYDDNVAAGRSEERRQGKKGKTR